MANSPPGVASPENGSLTTLAARILEWYEMWREYVSVGVKMKKWAVLACLRLLLVPALPAVALLTRGASPALPSCSRVPMYGPKCTFISSSGYQT